MAVGQTLVVRGRAYEVVWDGASRESLLSDYSRPSTLAGLAQDKQAKKEPQHRVERVRQFQGRSK